MVKFQTASNRNESIIYPDKLPYIWMDTFCVPVRTRFQAVRTQAIRSLRDIYKHSDKVLVLDAELQQISLDQISWNNSELSRTEFMFRFAMSGWNTRLWTMQEGMLAGNLYMALSDGIVRAKDLYFRSALISDALTDTMDEGLTILSKMCFTHHHSSSKPQDIMLGEIMIALRQRQTSRESDETICLTNCLGNDPGELEETDTGQRTQKFLRSLKAIPPALLFMGEPRMQERGFRWAPTSFLNRKGSCYDAERWVIQSYFHPMPDRRAAELMPDGSGLLIESLGIYLTEVGSLPRSSEFLIELSLSHPPYVNAGFVKIRLVTHLEATHPT